MQIIRATSYQRMPWKNGGGETAEIAVSPAGADMTQMDWRLSMATVASDGPFSSFPGIDRTLSVLDGTLTLDVEGAAVALSEDSGPFAFAGEVKVSGIVDQGPVTDLNVMTRRDRFTHDVQRIVLTGPKTLNAATGLLAVFCSRGTVTVPTAHGPMTLGARDTALCTQGTIQCVSQAPATLYVIAIRPR